MKIEVSILKAGYWRRIYKVTFDNGDTESGSMGEHQDYNELIEGLIEFNDKKS